MPLAGHAPELVYPAIIELEPRPDHQIAQRARHQHVVAPRQGTDACADVHGDPADGSAAALALAGVQSGTHLDTQRLHRVADRHGTADRPLRAVEHRQETVARRAHLSTAKTSEL